MESLPLSPPVTKRKRVHADSEALTPPLTADDPEGTLFLSRAVHVLSTAATALSHITILYQSDPVAREGLLQAVECIKRVNEAGGKLLVCGVGKSGLVGRKTVASMKSLGVACSFLHAAEALHGDLGDIKPSDAVMFISYSGKTPELMAVLGHVPSATPVLAVTSHTKARECPLLRERPDGILLPAPIHELEEVSFGVCAPTTSTTVAIAVGDMLALTVAEALHADDKENVFRKNHPGGAIGQKPGPTDVIEEVEEKEAKKQKGLASPA
ncbi:SIS domain-containing protein [Lentithecium fluviatile CBS 122367]|uniref:SIS domain-containing protein n=1 Tax=Lentithecium fluviatile CBS 122367 TaxID=1168545 RepID=A0A6G1IR79_9PLEO|nr:SIS domain-containing protein [Lentithecium fluviatile CBS 122367]